ncbi:MAG: SCO family protein [Alphaproteobacteria bacterium]|nr:SCO family protein [Alphaproteobacteria bacterium]
MEAYLKKRLMRTALLSLIAAIVGIGIGLFQMAGQDGATTQKPVKSTPIAGIQIGGPFELTDHNGQRVSEKDFAGSYKLIYFGFTYCPAICPTELQKITRVMKALPEEAAAKIQPLFITVDPERDTVEVMKDYVSLFDPRLIGLTGSRDDIDRTLDAYRIFATKVQEEGAEDYTMDHSSFIYLMSPDDRLISIYRIQDDAEMMRADILKILGVDS